jgi:hypothetical protein
MVRQPSRWGIDSFEDPHSKFTKHFSLRKRQVQSKTKIFNIRRWNSETMEDFITRYNKESLQIKGVGKDLRISGFIQGVRSDGLVREIHRDGVPNTVESIIDIVKSWVWAENGCNLMREIDSRRTTRRDNCNTLTRI